MILSATESQLAHHGGQFVVQSLFLFSRLDSRARACSPLYKRLYGLPGGVPARRVPGFMINFVSGDFFPPLLFLGNHRLKELLKTWVIP